MGEGMGFGCVGALDFEPLFAVVMIARSEIVADGCHEDQGKQIWMAEFALFFLGDVFREEVYS